MNALHFVEFPYNTFMMCYCYIIRFCFLERFKQLINFTDAVTTFKQRTHFSFVSFVPCAFSDLI